MKYYFAKKLSDLRKSKGLSQEELAEALYVTRQAISKWENGSGILDIVNIKAIADYFKVSVDVLLDDDVDLPINVDNNKDNLIKENNKANDDFKPLSSEPKYYKKDVKSNKLKFQIIQQVAALLGLLFIIIGFFTPFYQFEYSIINYQYSLMDYIFSESNVVFGVLYLFSLVILLLSLGIGDLTFKKNETSIITSYIKTYSCRVSHYYWNDLFSYVYARNRFKSRSIKQWCWFLSYIYWCDFNWICYII